MNIVSAGPSPDLVVASGSNRLADAENQKDAWLRQMEQEQMAALQQDHKTTFGAAQPARSGPDANKENRADDQDGNPSKKSLATVLTVHPVIGQSAEIDPLQTAVGASLAGVIMHSAGAEAQDGVGAGAQYAAALAAATTGHATEGMPETAAIAPITGSGKLAALRFGANPAASGEASGLESEQDATAQAQHESAGADWQKRLIHIAGDGNEISVSIRDSALDSRQSAQIVGRLAGDALQNGMRIKQATVNGKVMIKPARSAGSVYRSTEPVAPNSVPSTIEPKE